MSEIQGVNVASTVVPYTTDDTYPTHDSQYGKGGWHEVGSIDERDAIPSTRLRFGMVVNVVGDQAYEWTADGWIVFATGGTVADPSLITMTAGIDLSGHRVVIPDGSGNAIYPDITVLADGLALVGITTGAIANGDAGAVQIMGSMTEVSWTWTPGLPIYSDDGGVLTQTLPSGSWVRQIAVAITATKIAITPQTLLSTP
jgi:hypothetical protein